MFRWCEPSQCAEGRLHNPEHRVTSSIFTKDNTPINNVCPVLELDTDLSSAASLTVSNPGKKSFMWSLKIRTNTLFYILWQQRSTPQLSCPKRKVSSAEEFLHEKVTDISSLQWHGDKSGKSYRAALHSLQYLLPVLIIRLIKLQGGGVWLPTVTFCFSGEGEGMAN